MKIFKVLLPVFAMAFVVGCSSVDSTAGLDDGAPDDMSGYIPDDGSASAFGVAGVGVAPNGGPIEDTGMLLDIRVIYFELDSVQVSAESLDTLAQHGEFLSLHPQSTMRIEGHADERGSREYNLGLGERRAQAVRSRTSTSAACRELASTSTACGKTASASNR